MSPLSRFGYINFIRLYYKSYANIKRNIQLRLFSNITIPRIRNCSMTAFQTKVPFLALLPFVNCASKLTQELDPETFSHEYLMKQACHLTVDASTQLLTITVAALLDANEGYRSVMQRLIALVVESLEAVNMSTQQDEIWEQVIEYRNLANDCKKTILELTTFMEYVERSANSAAETSFLGGAEYASTAMCERIYSAQQQIKLDHDKTKLIEDEWLKIQQSHIYKVADSAQKNKNK